MATFNGIIFEALPKLRGGLPKTRKRTQVLACSVVDNKEGGTSCPAAQATPTRRSSIAISIIAVLVGNATTTANSSFAQDNGFWVTGPLPVPYANNKISNEETGTRSFLKKGIYIANIGTKGRMHRLKRYAFDLIAMGDLIAQQDAWNYVRRFLRLKSTFMYFDFDEVITAAPADDKQPLMNLANRLFDSFEKLEVAVREQNVAKIESCYQDTTSVLEEVMIRMA